MVKKLTPTSGAHRAAGRILDVLEHLAKGGQTLTLADLSHSLDVPKSSMLPLLRTLAARHWIEQPTPISYRLSDRHPIAGRWHVEPLELPKVARPFLERLTHDTGESSFVGVMPHGADSVVYIEKVESPRVIRYGAELGEQRPLHCTAVGLAIFAFLPPARRDELLRGMRPRKFTGRTSTSTTAIKRRLSQVRQDGVITTLEEYVQGAGAIAAPIFDRNNAVVGAVSLAGPADRLRSSVQPLTDAVKSASLAISVALGWRPALVAR